MQDFLSYDEQQVLRQVAAGDESAYEVLYNRYWDHIYSTALQFTKSPELAEDLAQDVFARVWVKKEKLAEVEKFHNYLFIMARNIIYDKLRKVVYSGEYDEHFINYFSDSDITPDNRLELKELEDIIEAGIQSLPPQQQKAFRLSRFRGLSHEQIAEEMGISRLSVKNHIVRAMYNLRNYLDGHTDSLAVVIWIILFL